MHCLAKTFVELTVDELYEILAARAAVFVVEQHCAYQDVDGIDRRALHVWLEEDGKILAYLRAFPVEIASADSAEAATGKVVQIGRVLSTVRGRGLGRQIMEAGLQVVYESFAPDAVVLDAQCYAQGFYERLGFTGVGDVFDEDGIPHIRMVRREASRKAES